MQQNYDSLSGFSLKYCSLMKFFILFILSIFLSGCNNDSPPRDIIEEQKMVGVLADLHTIDGYMSTLMYSDTFRVAGKNYYATVYKKHNISKPRFDKSLKYYSAQPELLDSMYSKVEIILKKKEERLNKIQEMKQKKLTK
jgi:predicted nucleotidyltransferase